MQKEGKAATNCGRRPLPPLRGEVEIIRTFLCMLIPPVSVAGGLQALPQKLHNLLPAEGLIAAVHREDAVRDALQHILCDAQLAKTHDQPQLPHPGLHARQALRGHLDGGTAPQSARIADTWPYRPDFLIEPPP